MKKNKLQFYEVDDNYISYLRAFDEKVPQSKIEDRKQSRKYIGVVFTVNNIMYLAPLSSFKQNKHTNMKEMVDFLKVGNYAVINLNNMIPVKDSVVKPVYFEAVVDLKYKDVLENEYKIIKSKKEKILKNANIIYKQVTLFNKPIAKRCCNFKLLESKCLEYK